MLINPNGFREYDARWLYQKDIDLKGIENLGKGLGSQVINRTKKINPRVIVGHDYRSYSEEIKTALKRGLISTGCNIEDIGLALSFPIGCLLAHGLNGQPEANESIELFINSLIDSYLECLKDSGKTEDEIVHDAGRAAVLPTQS